MNQLNNHLATCESCGKRLKEDEYIWDIIEDRIICKECWSRKKVEVPENIMDTFINFFHLPK